MLERLLQQIGIDVGLQIGNDRRRLVDVVVEPVEPALLARSDRNGTSDLPLLRLEQRLRTNLLQPAERVFGSRRCPSVRASTPPALL